MSKCSAWILSLVLIVSVFTSQWSYAQTEEEMRAVLQGIHEAHNAQDMDTYLTYLMDDFLYDLVPFPFPTLMNREEFHSFFLDMFEADSVSSVDDGLVLISDNILVQEHNIFGSGEKSFQGLPPLGEHTWPHVDIFEFEGDKIKKGTTYGDYAFFLMLAGLLPAPELPELIPSFTLPDPTPSGLSPLDVVLETDALWNAKDLNNYAKYFASDADLFLCPLGAPISRDAFIAVHEMHLLAFPDRQLESKPKLDCGDGWVVSEIVFKGTNTCPYLGFPPSGRPFDFRGVYIQQINVEGLITYMHVYYDDLTLSTQIGLIPESSNAQNWELYN